MAHEFWLEPSDYTVEPDGRLQAELVNGQFFEGTMFAYLPQRFVRFDAYADGDSAPVEGRIGNRPALDIDPLAEGLNVVVYESTVSVVRYDDFEAFLRFAEHKAFDDVEARHREAGYPTDAFGEAYTRYIKTLIGVGDAEGADLRTGLETEIVALDNPYTDDLAEGMRVQVFYGDAVRPGAQVELFAKAPDGSVEITRHVADAEGVATLPVTPGYSYLADSVVLREPSADLAAERRVVWETLWAALTFAVPA
ncbi:Nickel uptake substrate-specific transmembrane region [Roseisalinus antarcticus]|uniref:Nickel uptake substrate-specific transmembrane region n=2 Tax=Roseisalinus antarcticus TaxID=254357 RepID=A0A1Y5THF1_9RHOB|nr:Nickel uptake substrate-specific transmembrane region [Roseisalinus antarcticus]